MWSTSHSGIADRRTALAQAPCGVCEHRELIHSDDGPRRCLYSACACGGFTGGFSEDEAAA